MSASSFLYLTTKGKVYLKPFQTGDKFAEYSFLFFYLYTESQVFYSMLVDS